MISRDITHLKQHQAQLEATLANERVARADAEGAQHALAEQNERLRELDRLKDEFIALVSHEPRTPLTSIHGYLELVLDGGAGELGPEQQRFLSVVERNTKRLMQLVGDLLFMAQVEAGKLALDLEEVDLKEVLRPVHRGREARRRRHTVELVADLAETPSMLGDRSRLAQVLDNLISNALKFTPASVASRFASRTPAATQSSRSPTPASGFRGGAGPALRAVLPQLQRDGAGDPGVPVSA